MKRWSKLQRDLYNVIAPEIDLQIHCAVYRMDSQCGRTSLPRCWITLGRQIVWDYPKQFVDRPTGENTPISYYPYSTDMSAISDLIREYIMTPSKDILSKHFKNDHWGLVNILRAADRRVGERRLHLLRRKTHNKAALMIIARRLGVRQRAPCIDGGAS